MKVSTHEPTQTGRYACYLPDVGLATVIRIFLVGHGWFSNLNEKVSGPVAGWIGPLPDWPENSVHVQVEALDAWDHKALPADQEFDL